MKRARGFLSVVAVTFVLAAPLAAQTLKLSASVPFEFTVAGRSMPAGDYRIDAGSTPMGTVRVSSGNESAYLLAIRDTASRNQPIGQSLLVFHRYGDQYFLSSIEDGSLIDCRGTLRPAMAHCIIMKGLMSCRHRYCPYNAQV